MSKPGERPLVMVEWSDITGHDTPWVEPEDVLEMTPAPMVTVGIVVNLTSEAGMIDPPLKLARGGWGFAHGATKAALHRMAGYLKVEYGDRGIRAYNLEPGLVLSESFLASLGEDSELEKLGSKYRVALLRHDLLDHPGEDICVPLANRQHFFASPHRAAMSPSARR